MSAATPFHYALSPIARSKGQSVVARAAYHSGTRLEGAPDGRRCDYRRKVGVHRDATRIFAPAEAPAWAKNLQEVWAKAEQAERNKDGRYRAKAVVGRSAVVALPAELPHAERVKIAHEIGAYLTAQYQTVCQVDVHAPDKSGDARNHHAHFVIAARHMTAEGFGKKIRELDDMVKAGPAAIERDREQVAAIINAALERGGSASRWDHRSNAERGIDIEPSQHEGQAVTALERKGVRTQVRADLTRRREADQARRQALTIDRETLSRLDAEIAAAEAAAQPAPASGPAGGLRPGTDPAQPKPTGRPALFRAVFAPPLADKRQPPPGWWDQVRRTKALDDLMARPPLEGWKITKNTRLAIDRWEVDGQPPQVTRLTFGDGRAIWRDGDTIHSGGPGRASQQQIEAMIAIAEASGWKPIEVFGSENFKARAWLTASVRGLTVTGYQPTNADIAALEALRIQTPTTSGSDAAVVVAHAATRRAAHTQDPSGAGPDPNPPTADVPPASPTQPRGYDYDQ